MHTHRERASARARESHAHTAIERQDNHLRIELAPSRAQLPIGMCSCHPFTASGRDSIMPAHILRAAVTSERVRVDARRRMCERACALLHACARARARTCTTQAHRGADFERESRTRLDRFIHVCLRGKSCLCQRQLAWAPRSHACG
eukprot:6204705-Pleurochrysis_carterae.AAC.1